MYIIILAVWATNTWDRFQGPNSQGLPSVHIVPIDLGVKCILVKRILTYRRLIMNLAPAL